MSVQNEGDSYKTTNASFVEAGFLELWKITVITVLLVAYDSHIVASCVWTHTHLFRLVCVLLPKANKILLHSRCQLHI